MATLVQERMPRFRDLIRRTPKVWTLERATRTAFARAFYLDAHGVPFSDPDACDVCLRRRGGVQMVPDRPERTIYNEGR